MRMSYWSKGSDLGLLDYLNISCGCCKVGGCLVFSCMWWRRMISDGILTFLFVGIVVVEGYRLPTVRR